jgi:hypothetical protein
MPHSEVHFNASSVDVFKESPRLLCQVFFEFVK